uniref:Chemokine (C-C motif) ligand 36, duplicate 1 n=1 Tax=Pygocentrus nattereri TaxID=42514 RepID=A0AAR2J626_PYGNA
TTYRFYLLITLLVKISTYFLLNHSFCLIDPNTPSKCCFNFYKTAIPMNFIAKYEKTRSDCPNAGVVFTTKRGISLCLKPRVQWVKRAMDYIDLQIVENNSTSASV